MTRLFAQGDILFEEMDDYTITGRLPSESGADVVIAEGELTGHKHVLVGKAVFYRDDALARDIPDALYVGHVQVADGPVHLVHDEHAAIALNPGIYRVRRQRQLDPSDWDIFGD